jgi:hypothetical protein
VVRGAKEQEKIRLAKLEKQNLRCEHLVKLIHCCLTVKMVVKTLKAEKDLRMFQFQAVFLVTCLRFLL